jgi:hypothetical protein
MRRRCCCKDNELPTIANCAQMDGYFAQISDDGIAWRIYSSSGFAAPCEDGPIIASFDFKAANFIQWRGWSSGVPHDPTASNAEVSLFCNSSGGPGGTPILSLVIGFRTRNSENNFISGYVFRKTFPLPVNFANVFTDHSGVGNAIHGASGPGPCALDAPTSVLIAEVMMP